MAGRRKAGQGWLKREEVDGRDGGSNGERAVAKMGMEGEISDLCHHLHTLHTPTSPQTNQMPVTFSWWEEGCCSCATRSAFVMISAIGGGGEGRRGTSVVSCITCCSILCSNIAYWRNGRERERKKRERRRGGAHTTTCLRLYHLSGIHSPVPWYGRAKEGLAVLFYLHSLPSFS